MNLFLHIVINQSTVDHFRAFMSNGTLNTQGKNPLMAIAQITAKKVFCHKLHCIKTMGRCFGFMIFTIFISIGLSTQYTHQGLDSRPVDYSSPPSCQPIPIPFCNITAYTTLVPFNNSLGHVDIDSAIKALNDYTYLIQAPSCMPMIQLFLCSLYLPVCVATNSPSRILPPCRDECEEAKAHCQPDIKLVYKSWPEEWDCSKFPYWVDNQMCVTKNRTKSSQELQPTANPLPTSKYLSMDMQNLESTTKPTVPDYSNGTCGELFDCRMKNLPLCIEHSAVCNGIIDCIHTVTNETNDLDEQNCASKCGSSLIWCDQRCISDQALCDGKVDCNSGSDESSCYDNSVDTLRMYALPIVCIFVLIYAACVVMRAPIHKDDPKSLDTGESPVDFFQDASRESTDKDLDQMHDETFIPQAPFMKSSETNITSTIHHLNAEPPQSFQDDTFARNLSDALDYKRPPIYNEPTYSTCYERLNVGGYSGASSVGYYDSYHQSPIYGEYQSRSRPCPSASPTHSSSALRAPPPTPDIQSISSISQPIYINDPLSD